MPRRIKTGPTPWVTSWDQRNRNVEPICGENDSGERSKAIMVLLSKDLYCRHIRTRACLGKGQAVPHIRNDSSKFKTVSKQKFFRPVQCEEIAETKLNKAQHWSFS